MTDIYFEYVKTLISPEVARYFVLIHVAISFYFLSLSSRKFKVNTGCAKILVHYHYKW